MPVMQSESGGAVTLMSSLAKDIVEHLEQTLGTIQQGWRGAESDENSGVNVFQFDEAPESGFTTFSTVGLSYHKLSQISGHIVRMELILSCQISDGDRPVPSRLMDVAEDLVESHHAPPRGSVIGRSGPLFDNGQLTAFYCSVPVFFPEEFHLWEGSSPETILVQLIPISNDECQYIDHFGWNEFENHLERTDPDVFDLNRVSSLRHLPSGDFIVRDDSK